VHQLWIKIGYKST